MVPVALAVPPVAKFPPVTVPVELTMPLVNKLAPVMLPPALAVPPVAKLPPVMVPVTLKLVPVAAPILGVVNTAPAGMYNWLLPLTPIVVLAVVS